MRLVANVNPYSSPPGGPGCQAREAAGLRAATIGQPGTDDSGRAIGGQPAGARLPLDPSRSGAGASCCDLARPLQSQPFGGVAPTMMDVQDRRFEAIAAAPAAAFTVVIPCYNEEQAIADTICSICAALSRLEEYAIIVVDDGSTDGSAAVLAGIERGDGICA